MQVELIDCTGWGTPDPARRAAEILVFTKGTRLNMDSGRINQVAEMSDEAIQEELRYMANTIPSSWEFIDYTFLLNDVSRGFTHQFVRTRTGSYAQQTMRVLDKRGWTYETGPSIEADMETAFGGEEIEGENLRRYKDTMSLIAEAYDFLVDNGAEIEDARGVLPTNIHTNIVAKFNLRTLCDMFRKRSSGRTQSEYREVVDMMRACVLRVHPWAEMFIERDFDRSAKELEDALRGLSADGIDDRRITDMVKLVDQMRMQA